MGKRQHAETDARECAFYGSAAAAHRMNFSSANIPAVSFVINAPICRRAATKEIRQTILVSHTMPSRQPKATPERTKLHR
jgi:hypothetical protein